ncbi:MAG: hypothetical protein IJT15_00955 [Rickettsiales bacterium]|nr:hypothetical protein [Rickettsiales bacterium]
MGLFDTEIENTANNVGDTFKNNTDANKKTNNEKKVVKKAIKEPKLKVLKDDTDNEIKFPITEIKTFSNFTERMLERFKNKTLHHATMIVGDYGIGKATCAYWLISQMVLSQITDEEIKTANLQLLQEGVHPDVFVLQAKAGENEIKVDDVRLLIDKLSLKSVYGNKFILIDDINSINANGVNALLKILEEPQDGTFFFIINHGFSKVLDTIYSRCNQEKLSLKQEQCISVLKEAHPKMNNDELSFYANISANSIAFAEMMMDMQLFSFDFGNIDNLKNNLNTIYKKIDDKYKNLPKIIKISLLERIMFFAISKINNDFANNSNLKKDNIEFRKIVALSTSLSKQIIDIKKYDLSVIFS